MTSSLSGETVKHTYDCDKESCETADRLALYDKTSIHAIQESCETATDHARVQDIKDKTSIQLEDLLSKTVSLSPDELSKVAHVGNSPNRNSRSSTASRKIGTSSYGSLLTCLEFLGN
jgi:hypothetical protein